MLTHRLIWALRGFAGPNCSPNAAPLVGVTKGDAIYLNSNKQRVNAAGDLLNTDGTTQMTAKTSTAPAAPKPGSGNPTQLMAGEGNCHYNPFSNALQNVNRGPGAYVSKANPNYNADVANRPDVLEWLDEPTFACFDTELLSADFVISGEFGAHGFALGSSVQWDNYEQDYGGFNNRATQPCQNPFNTDASSCPNDSGVWAFLAAGTPSQQTETVLSSFAEVQ